MSGGAAFWAARGVRIEPETVDEDLVEEPDAVDEAATDTVGEAEVVEQAAEPESEPEQHQRQAVVPEAREPEETVAPEPESEPEQVVEPEQAQAVELEPEPEPVPEPEPAPASESEPDEPAQAAELPGFPQQRTAATAPSPAAEEESPDEESSDKGSDASAEPAWQLTGGELANPLPPLKTCIEAILMVVDEPVSVVLLAQVLERPTAEVAEALTELAEEYTVLGRGFELREVGVGSEGDRTGWRVYSRAECAAVVERFVRDGQQAKLTQAALETLAVVAYRQPVSRSKVSAIRGVNCDGVMRTLLARGLVEEYGNDHETGAILYQTTGYFLERMGLKSLDELPELAPLLPSAAEVDVEDFA